MLVLSAPHSVGRTGCGRLSRDEGDMVPILSRTGSLSIEERELYQDCMRLVCCMSKFYNGRFGSPSSAVYICAIYYRILKIFFKNFKGFRNI